MEALLEKRPHPLVVLTEIFLVSENGRRKNEADVLAVQVPPPGGNFGITSWQS
jgi:hypothetical protein